METGSNVGFGYEAISRPRNREEVLPADELVAATEYPRRMSNEVRALVQSWRNGTKDDRVVIRRALDYFKSEKFSYTLTPETFRDRDIALAEFLFQRRAGFCEHFAGAFATLMRVAGIPSRVVLGYLGGEFNGNYVEVLQSDAHAWCEVWIRGVGWERIDPTSVIAPERITEGFESYLASRATGAGAAFRAGTRWAGLRRIYDGAHLFWANLTFQWDLRVLNYDSNHQRSFIAYTGLAAWRWSELSTGLAAMIVLILGAVDSGWCGRTVSRPIRLPGGSSDFAECWPRGESSAIRARGRFISRSVRRPVSLRRRNICGGSASFTSSDGTDGTVRPSRNWRAPCALCPGGGPTDDTQMRVANPAWQREIPHLFLIHVRDSRRLTNRNPSRRSGMTSGCRRAASRPTRVPRSPRIPSSFRRRMSPACSRSATC